MAVHYATEDSNSVCSTETRSWPPPKATRKFSSCTPLLLSLLAPASSLDWNSLGCGPLPADRSEGQQWGRSPAALQMPAIPRRNRVTRTTILPQSPQHQTNLLGGFLFYVGKFSHFKSVSCFARMLNGSSTIVGALRFYRRL